MLDRLPVSKQTKINIHAKALVAQCFQNPYEGIKTITFFTSQQIRPIPESTALRKYAIACSSVLKVWCSLFTTDPDSNDALVKQLLTLLSGQPTLDAVDEIAVKFIEHPTNQLFQAHSCFNTR